MSHTHKGVVTRSTILCLIGLCILGVVSGGGMISWTSVYLTNLKHTHNIQTHPSKMRPLPSPDWSINEQIWDSRMCRTSIFLRSSHIPHSWMPTFLYLSHFHEPYPARYCYSAACTFLRRSTSSPIHATTPGLPYSDFVTRLGARAYTRGDYFGNWWYRGLILWEYTPDQKGQLVVKERQGI